MATKSAARAAPKAAPAVDAGGRFRTKSAADAAKLLGVSRNTVQGWIDEGCPCVSKPVRPGDGDSYRLDLAEIVRWRIAKAVAEAKVPPKGRPSDGDEDDDPKGLTDPEQRLKVANLAVKLLKEQKKVVLVDEVDALFERALGLIRQSVMAMPNRVIRFVPGLGVAETQSVHRKITDAAADTMEDAHKLVTAFVARARKDAEGAGW